MSADPSWDAILYVRPKFDATSNTFSTWLEALRSLRKQRPFANADIYQIESRVNFPEGKATDNYLHRFRLDPPTSISNATFDPRYTIALYLKNNSAFIDDYTEANLKDEEVLVLSRRIEARRDHELKEQHVLRVHLANGDTLEKTISHSNLYHDPYKVDRERYDSKFAALTKRLGDKAQQEVRNHLMAVKDVENMRAWCRHLAALTKDETRHR